MTRKNLCGFRLLASTIITLVATISQNAMADACYENCEKLQELCLNSQQKSCGEARKDTRSQEDCNAPNEVCDGMKTSCNSECIPQETEAIVKVLRRIEKLS
jgi:hypothetical protein